MDTLASPEVEAPPKAIVHVLLVWRGRPDDIDHIALALPPQLHPCHFGSLLIQDDAHTSSNQVLHENKLPTHGDKANEEPENIHTHIDLLGDGRRMFELFDQGVKHTPPR
ncbi:hypothetical protein PIB30_097741 [Stylosanthes scabra]|uniref:Uncharacterized protein n=1 Tax=Stylosanthes scabra TaxID=79078 RepID=A0ABU6TZG2_9FABA|nr:hypothetical protein [Stylosanthes scabra]